MLACFASPRLSAAVLALAGLLAVLAGCRRDGPVEGDTDAAVDGGQYFRDGAFFCPSLDATACVDDVWLYCVPDVGEFYRAESDDCASRGEVCLDGRGCAVCHPGAIGCDDEGQPVLCNDDGSAWVRTDVTCDTAVEYCDSGRCTNLCDEATANSSYVGCEFYAVDLDNAAVAEGRDASAQQYAVVVSNPGFVVSDVTVEIDTVLPGGTSVPRVVTTVSVPPGDLEILRLPRREVDGSSSLASCVDTNDVACASNESCWCAGGVRPETDGATGCRCRIAPEASGFDDGTNTALTSNAYRITSTTPVVAYQFNPLDNVSVFSNDASLLIPTSAIGATYTVIGWPQTIANSDDPAEDFDTSSTDEDLRAFLTIVGTREATRVTVTLGPEVRQVVGLESGAFLYPGDVVEVELGSFDVLNLETQGFNADFTGTRIVATNPVSVFSGSEASDAPRFDDLANRQCCADHLEEQLFPEGTLGRHFFIGRTPPRSHALNAAFLTADSVGEYDEPEFVRIVSATDGTTVLTTTLPSPNDLIELGPRESVILEADQDFELESDQPIAVLQVLASQQEVGIPSQYPGGDPSIIAVPPVEQYRRDYVFLTPLYYAFDFVTIVAPYGAEILLDEAPLDPDACTSAAADGLTRRDGDPPPAYLVYRCQLSFPDVIGAPNVRIEDGVQDDGYHTLRANDDVSLIVSGFDAYVSYAYTGGLDLDPIF